MKNVLVVDVGGTHVKILATGQTERRKFDSGPQLSPDEMVAGVKALAEGWSYDAVSMGYPGPVRHGTPAVEPINLGEGWVGFDYEQAFGCPVKIMNDAAMQALGSYDGGRMLFLGLGTGLGTTLIIDGTVAAMELAHLPYKKKTFEEYVGERAMDRRGKKKWRKDVEEVVADLAAAMLPDEVVIGGGNVKHLKDLPEGCRRGDNENAFAGGFRMWDPSHGNGRAKGIE
jgi:predicted NBD/HSP70 family sugar kinase